MENANETVGAVISGAQEWAGISDEELARKAGYDVRVIQMIKSGRMRLPVNKVAAVADAIHLDAPTLLKAVLTESSPDLWKAVFDILRGGDLSDAEKNLIRHLRALAGKRELAPIAIDASSIVALVCAQ